MLRRTQLNSYYFQFRIVLMVRSDEDQNLANAECQLKAGLNRASSVRELIGRAKSIKLRSGRGAH